MKMKTINYIFLLVIFFLVSCNFSTPKESGCNCLSNNELKLTAINDIGHVVMIVITRVFMKGLTIQRENVCQVIFGHLR